ncbi:hypothetical protein WT08_00185 [Burkholderia sp. MSMB1552]|nr:hypothetical protein WT08_00185 [Burkholderia sp. MSMB1552]KWZ50469.1 hypothetical protein WS92_24055 [Burkholderia sp. MSMB1588]
MSKLSPTAASNLPCYRNFWPLIAVMTITMQQYGEANGRFQYFHLMRSTYQMRYMVLTRMS